MFEQLDNEHKMFMLDFLRALNEDERGTCTEEVKE